MARSDRAMNCTALVTGASSGIGRELADLCARDDLDVVLVARRRDRLLSLRRVAKWLNAAARG